MIDESPWDFLQLCFCFASLTIIYIFSPFSLLEVPIPWINKYIFRCFYSQCLNSFKIKCTSLGGVLHFLLIFIFSMIQWTSLELNNWTHMWFVLTYKKKIERCSCLLASFVQRRKWCDNFQWFNEPWKVLVIWTYSKDSSSARMLFLSLFNVAWLGQKGEE